ncbi:MAG: hypothetical protein HYV16_10120 [Gammaproteobacteria bacterium]|nr:hypothetical protein [Gammaproteobacteria bacterium]
MPSSLSGRLLLAASLVLAVFVGMTALILEKAYEASLTRGVGERLEAHIHALLSQAEEIRPGELSLPQFIRENRFNQLESGLYGWIVNGRGEPVWRSQSASGQDVPRPDDVAAGETRFEEVLDAEGAGFFLTSYGVLWEGDNEAESRYTIHVAEGQEDYRQMLVSYRRQLWGWLTALAAVLLIVQYAVMHWGLTPLKRAAEQLQAVEEGRSERIDGQFPFEVQALTDNINLLIKSERAQRERYRASLGDLAHSLKTPLAVLQGATGSASDDLVQAVNEQVPRMNQIVKYQLQRAATSGISALAKPVDVQVVAGKIVAALAKVYVEKGVQVEMQVAAQARFYGDEGDLFEMLGNLLDNAHQWCKSRVRVLARPLSDRTGRQGLELCIEDDGPGVPLEHRERLGQRGVRVDSRVPGHGIGLAVVVDIVLAYGGQMQIADSDWGGASFQLRFPV